MDYKHTCDTISTHFQGITNINNIYGFGRPFLLLHFITCPPPVHPYFYPSTLVFPPSKWRVDGSLHRTMLYSNKHVNTNFKSKTNFVHIPRYMLSIMYAWIIVYYGYVCIHSWTRLLCIVGVHALIHVFTLTFLDWQNVVLHKDLNSCTMASKLNAWSITLNWIPGLKHTKNAFRVWLQLHCHCWMAPIHTTINFLLEIWFNSV